MAIGEVARRSGQTVVALRHWEAVGLLPSPPRAGGKRRYPEEVLTRIGMIDLVRHAGFSLVEIRDLLDGRLQGEPPGPRWQAQVARKEADLDKQLAAVHAARRLLTHLGGCRCRSLEECVARSVSPHVRSHNVRRRASAGDRSP